MTIPLFDRLKRVRISLPDDRQDLMRKTIDYGLLALLVFSPLPAASVNEWSILVIQLTVGIMAAAYVFLERKPGIHPQLEPLLRWLKYGILGFFGFLLFQILPLPAFLVRLLSPGTYEFHKLYSPHFFGMDFMSLSVMPSQTFREGLELLTYFLLGFLIIKNINRSRQFRRIVLVLVGMGVFQALYGLFALSSDNPRILFYKKVFSLDSVTGTFVNRSHLSFYLELIVPLAIGLVIARMNFFSPGAKGFKERILLMTSQGFSTSLLITTGIIVMSLGIVFSQSRAGIFVLVFTFFLFAEFAVFHFSRIGFRQQWIKNFIRGTFLLITIMALSIGIGSTIERFALDDLLHESRPLYWTNVMNIIGDFPLFGTGLGTFSSTYPAYEEFGGPELQLVHAHNDYLEFLSELGIIGVVFLFGVVLFMAVKSFLAWRERRNPEVKGLVLGMIVSLIGAGVHTLTDFSLHIPANAVLFTVIISLTLVMAYHRKT